MKTVNRLTLSDVQLQAQQVSGLLTSGLHVKVRDGVLRMNPYIVELHDHNGRVEDLSSSLTLREVWLYLDGFETALRVTEGGHHAGTILDT